MLDRMIDSDRSLAPETRHVCRMRDGHRREYDPRQEGERVSFHERSKRALADVGIYRSVSFRDLAEAHFGGHPYTTRRAVNRWIEDGLVRESTAKGPKGQPFKVLTPTPKGADTARKLAVEQNLDPGQQIESGLGQRAQIVHDTAIYRACRRESQHLLQQGATLQRVRLDAELKSAIARRSETARVRDGRQAADAERRRAAQDLGLPIDEHGSVHYPDAQLEYTDENGRTGRVNVEVASGHYSASAIRAKARAGFAVHATGSSQARVLRALGTGEDHASIRGPAQRDPAAFEL